MTLLLSPDHKFLSSDLFDLGIDPAEQEQRKDRELMATLGQGRFASIGPKDADVTIVEFSDFQCPFCNGASAVLKKFLATPEGERVRVIFRNFPLPIHPWAKPAAEAAACLTFQKDPGLFWKTHDWLFENQRGLTVENVQAKILDFVRTLPDLNAEAYQQCLSDGLSVGAVMKDVSLGAANEVRGTPTFFINGRLHVGLRSMEELRTLVNEVPRPSGPAALAERRLQ